MKMFPRFYSLLLALAPELWAQNPPDAETFSDNKRFSVEISATQPDKPLLTVFRHEGESVKVQKWSRLLVSKDEVDPDPMFFVRVPDWNTARTLVSDDGKAVVIRPRHNEPQLPAVRVLTESGGDKSYEEDDLRDHLDATWEDWRVPQPLELLLAEEKPPLFAMWFPPTAEWLVVDMETLAMRKADATLVAKIDAVALHRARQIAHDSRPTGLKKLLQPVLQKAAQFAPNLIGQPQAPSVLDGRAEAAYRFLTYKRNSGDKRLIEALLEGDLQKSIGMGSGGPMGTTLQVGLISRERVLGDELLAQWEAKPGETDQKAEDVDSMMFGPERKGHRLSNVRGEVQLPFGAPSNAGAVWIYLIPASVGKGKWPGHPSILKASVEPDVSRMFARIPGQGKPESVDRFSFFFSTVEPGEYRVKAVWDRRPPHAPTDEKAMCVPEAGDYESAESDTLKLKPGEALTDVILLCTNRVGQAAELFAADEEWLKKNPPSRRASHTRKRLAKKAVMAAPLQEWVLKTNENPASLDLKRVQLTGIEFDGIESRQLEVSFRMRGVKRHQHPPIKAELVDDHGCRFETRGYKSQGNTYHTSFAVVPYGSKQWVLTLVRQDYHDDQGRALRNGMRNTPLASFTLTNLCQVKPVDWKADPEPLKEDLGIVTVELSSFDPGITEYTRSPEMLGADGQPIRLPQNKFIFTTNGKTAPGCRKIHGVFNDRWGNRSATINAFCEEEELFQYVVTLMRDPVKGIFAADEKLEIPVRQIPGPGESLPLAVRKALQGLEFEVLSVGGSGEFTYKDGTFISAKEEIADEEVVVQSGPPFGPGYVPQFGGRPVQPKMYLKGGARREMGFPHLRRQLGRGEVTIVSKIPHVVCWVPEPESDTKFALVEQDTSVADPLDSSSNYDLYYRDPGGLPSTHNVVQFLPLDYRTGDTDRKLTFIVQKTRKVEFLVRVPKGSRRPNRTR